MYSQVKCLFAIVLGLTVGVLSAVLGLHWSIPEITNAVPNNILCLPKTENAADGVDGLTCGNVADELHNYFLQGIAKEYHVLEIQEKQESEKQDRPVSLKDYFERDQQQMKPAARFTGDIVKAEGNANKNLDLESIRKWLHGSRLTDRGGFRRYGIKYNKGRIEVPVGGTYQVYSFLYLYEPCIGGTGKPDVKNTNQSIKHSIYKFNIEDDHETELITAVQPHKKSANMYFNIYSSYISSIIQLRAGDELAVKVSNITYLSYPDVNFFGVNLI